MKLTETETKLLAISVKEATEEMNKNKSINHAKVKVMDWLLDGDEQVQVHLTITRDKSAFLDDFETEILN